MKLRHLLDNFCPQNRGHNGFVACAHSLCLLMYLCSCEESLWKYKTTSFSFNPISSTSTVFQEFFTLNRMSLTLTIFSLWLQILGKKIYISRQTLNQNHDRITLFLKQQKFFYCRISVIPSTYLNLLQNKREIN